MLPAWTWPAEERWEASLPPCRHAGISLTEPLPVPSRWPGWAALSPPLSPASRAPAKAPCLPSSSSTISYLPGLGAGPGGNRVSWGPHLSTCQESCGDRLRVWTPPLWALPL